MKLVKTAATLVMALFVAFTTVFLYDAALPKVSGFSVQMQVDHGASIEPEEAKALVGVGLASRPSVMDPAKPLKPTAPPPEVQDPLTTKPPPATTTPEGGVPSSPSMASEPQSITTKTVTDKPSADVSASTTTPAGSVGSQASSAITPTGSSTMAVSETKTPGVSMSSTVSSSVSKTP